MTPLFEDRLITIRFVVPGRVLLGGVDSNAAEWSVLTAKVERAMETIFPLLAGFSMVDEKRE